MGQTVALTRPYEVSPQATVGPRDRIPALDGLRGIAILLVLVWHSIFYATPNSAFLSSVLRVGNLTWSGVDLFFVLSGFLIGGILLDALHSPNYYKTFYIRRAFRILPVYGLVVGAIFSAHWVLEVLTGSSGYFQSRIPWIVYPTFTQNLWMAYVGMFGSTWLGPTWSLAVEEQFYITAPSVMRWLTRPRLTLALASVVVGAPLLRTFVCLHFPHGGFAAYVLTPCRADALSLGVLAALLVRDRQWFGFVVGNRGALFGVTGGLLGCLMWFSYQQYDEYSRPMAEMGFSILALFYTGCLLITLLHTRLGDKILCSAGLMRLGRLAYCTSTRR